MFRQHKILCENKENIIYLFLYDQQIDLEIIKNIFSQIADQSLEARVLDYFNQHHIKCLGNHVRLVYRETIVKDFFLNQTIKSKSYANNVVNLY